MTDLTFTHTFQNGKTATLTVRRTGGMPVLQSSRTDGWEATEHADFLAWRNEIAETLPDLLAPPELLALACHGHSLLMRRLAEAKEQP